ncbi:MULTISPECIES: Bax inhibitor-1 family protein [Altibacter]|uniref:Bax inhibitor-1/YccA family protein n=1 Tax=Altibacter TaxID=1535231 RepID=UPI0005500198|nr:MULTISPECIES: Bax inhibitor-1 family protein [Altibacter]MCW8980510.1 Bax inhibitor-1 family protein [Altibacter sp.]MCW9038694.1 Bax inhibitor-1 family protein [Altibacter sp.]
MEELQQQPTYPTIVTLSDEKRVAFYRKTYTHLALAVLLFILVEMIFFQIPAVLKFALSLTEGWLWLLMLGGFMLVTNYAEKLALTNHDKNKQYLALLLYVVAEAFIFIPLIFMAMMIADDGGTEILNQAAILTLSLFSGLSAIVLLTKKDFSFLRSILAIGFFIALGLIVAGVLFGFNLGLWFSVGMVVLASGSILYQTSNMVHRYSEDQYVAASLGLFASLMLLFWYILSILSRD